MLKYFFLISLLSPFALHAQSYDLDAAAEKRWHINDVLSSDNTLPLVKDIYQNKQWFLTGNNGAMLSALLDSLPNMPHNARAFYVVVIAKTFDKAEGAYSDGMGLAGKDYIDSDLPEFLSYFAGAGKLPAIYLQKWAAITANEIESIKVNQDPNILTKLAKIYDPKCKSCSAEQKEVLRQFENLLKTYVK